MKHPFLSTLLAAFCLVSGVAQSSAADVCQVASPAKKNVLVELFTSDGCDSCPPANKWLSNALQGGDKALIPVSMHVTYWNYLGWKDGFSNAFFDTRQDAYAKTAVNKFSYTPELFTNGQEWRDWRDGNNAAIARSRQETAPVSINLTVRPQDKGNVSVDAAVAPAKGGDKVDLAASRLYLLLYEDSLTEHPNAGELRGAVLHHDHVIRDWKITDSIQAGKKVTQVFGIPPGANPKKLGIVAFVQGRDMKSVYQAVDAPLCF